MRIIKGEILWVTAWKPLRENSAQASSWFAFGVMSLVTNPELQDPAFEGSSSLANEAELTVIVIQSGAAVSVSAILVKTAAVSGVVVMISEDLLSECKDTDGRCKSDDGDEGKALHNPSSFTGQT